MEATVGRKKVTKEQLREAEAGLTRLLHAKRFPAGWIRESVPEIMSRARAEFAERLAVEGVEDAVNLLVVIGYRRAIKVVRAERSRPRETSIENFFHLADDSTPTPEQEALDHDRQETLVKAMGELPERERKLLALIYFQNMQIGEAGRRLGWAKASATRHHQAALEQLRALVGDRELLGVEVAIPAYIASRNQTAPRAAMAWMHGAAETLRESLLIGGNRAGALAETGNAAAMSGAGRTVAGACGTAVVVCLAGAASGVVGPGVGAFGATDVPTSSHHHVQRTYIAKPSYSSPRPAGGVTPKPVRERPGSKGRSVVDAPTTSASRPVPGSRPQQTSHSTPPASVQQTVNEFGVESGEPSDISSGGATENTPLAPQPQVAARPASGSASEGTSKSPRATSAGTQSSAEFGM